MFTQGRLAMPLSDVDDMGHATSFFQMRGGPHSDVKARHSSFLRQVAVAFVWIGRGRMEEMGWVSVI